MSKAGLARVATVESRYLYRVAALALAVTSVVALAGIGIGFFVMFRNDGPNVAVGAVVAVSSLAGWAMSAVPYLAGMALARYIEWRVS